MQKLVIMIIMIFSLNLKRKRKLIMKSLLYLRRLLIKYLNLNKLQTLNSSYT